MHPLILMAAFAALPAVEPGNVTVLSQTADAVTLSGSGGDRVLVRVLQPNLLQVDYRPGNQSSPNTLILDPGFATKSWTPGTVSIVDGTTEVTITTSALVARITKSPCRVSIYQTDGTTRIFGEPAAGGMTDSKVRIDYDAGINWYGIQSAPSVRGRNVTGSPISAYVSQTFITDLKRQNVSPITDLNARYHGSQTGPFAWSTGTASKPGFGILWDNDGGSVAFSANSLEMNKTGERGVSAVSATKLNTLWFAMVGTPDDITQALFQVSGKPQMFPKYAHGFGNTEWGINDTELRTHINGYRSRGIPLDQFTLDFDWKAWDLNAYGNFEWNVNAAPTTSPAYPGFPAAATTALKTYTDSQGVKLMGITKPRIHVATAQGSDVTNGSQAGALWRNAASTGWWLPTGAPSAFSNDYWGSFRGRSDAVGNLNFFIPAARAWYGQNTIERAFDKGIVGYWNDEGDEGPDSGDIPSASNFYNPLYQDSIYAYQRANRSGVRVWSMNRHSYLGAQRSGFGLWSGDIPCDWRILKSEAPRMLQTINAGMARTGTDAGGTSGSDSSVGVVGSGSVDSSIDQPELYARWVQFAAMQPTFRVHGVWKIQRQPWWYGDTAEDAASDAIRLRYRLMPYIYSHDHLYAETGTPFVRPLMWDNPKDVNAANRTDAWMFGRYLLASPVLESRVNVTSPDSSASVTGTTSKSIYLPAGTWYDFFRGTTHAGSSTLAYDVSASNWSDVPLFIKKGAIIPSLVTLPDSTSTSAPTVVRLDVFPDTAQTTFPYYDDDGVSYQYESGSFYKQDITLQRSGNTVTVGLAAKQGSYVPALQYFLIAINKFNASAVSGMTNYPSLAALEAAGGEGWASGADVHGTVAFIKVAAGSARILTVTGTDPGFAVVTTSLPVATRGARYDAQVLADGVGASATWSVTPTLPSGLALDQRTGRITGTPTIASSTTYTFQLTSGGSVSRALDLSVIAAPFAAFEAFRFSSGAIDWNGRSGENGFAGPWQRLVGGNGQGGDPVYPGLYVPGLSYSTLPTSGGGLQITSVQQVPGNSNSQKNPEFSRTLLTGFTDGGVAGRNAWVSFIGQGVTPGSGYLGIGLFQNTTEKAFIGQRYGQSVWGCEIAGGGGGGSSSANVATSAFVLMNMRVVGPSAREIRLWLNPTLGTTPPSDASAVVSFTTNTELSFDTIRLRGDSMISKLTVDELRVGATYADVSGVSVPQAELDITRSAVAIADGGTDSITSSAPAAVQNLSYVLTNSGTMDLQVTSPVNVYGLSNCTAAVTTQPASTLAPGATSTLTVAVTPTAAGAWSFALSLANTDANENPYNWTVSGTASTLLSPPVIITQPPTTLTVAEGNSATFTVVATGSGLTYQWRRNGVDIAGATSATYVIPAVSLAMSGDVFTVVVSGTGGTAVSSTGTTLQVTPLPTAMIPVTSSGEENGGCSLGGLTALIMALCVRLTRHNRRS